MEMPSDIELTLVKNFRLSIWSRFQKAVREYEMIHEGDRIALFVSGGEASMLMAVCMKRFHRYSKLPFEVEYLFADTGRSPDGRSKLTDNAARLEIPVKIVDAPSFDTKFCCKLVRDLGCNKIALGYHLDDVIETILAGMLYDAQIGTLLPKSRAEASENVQIIRPLYLVREGDIADWCGHNGLELMRRDCSCVGQAEMNDETARRREIKALLGQLRAISPAIDMNIFRSVQNVNLQTLIGYRIGDEYHHFLDTYDEGRSVRGTIKGDT